MAVPAKTQEIAISTLQAIEQADLESLDRAIKDKANKANEDRIVAQLIEKSSIEVPQDSDSTQPVMYVDDREGNENNEVGIRLTAALRKCEIDSVREEWNALQRTKRQALQQVSEPLTYERLAGVVKNLGKDYVLHERPVDEDVVGIIKNESGEIKHTFYNDGKQEVECPSTATDEDVVKELLKAYRATQPKEIKSITLSPIYIDGSPTALPNEKIAEIAKEIFSEGVSFSFTAVKSPQNTAGTKVAENAIEGGETATEGGDAAGNSHTSSSTSQKQKSSQDVVKRVIEKENATTNGLFTRKAARRWQAAAELLRTKERELFKEVHSHNLGPGQKARRVLAKKMMQKAIAYCNDDSNTSRLQECISNNQLEVMLRKLRRNVTEKLGEEITLGISDLLELLSSESTPVNREGAIASIINEIEKIDPNNERYSALLNVLSSSVQAPVDDMLLGRIKAKIQFGDDRFSGGIDTSKYLDKDEFHLFAELLGVNITCETLGRGSLSFGNPDKPVKLELKHRPDHYECAGRIGHELGRDNTAGDGICGITSMLQSLYYTTKDNPELQKSLSKFGKEMLGSVTAEIKKMNLGQNCQDRRESRFSR